MKKFRASLCDIYDELNAFIDCVTFGKPDNFMVDEILEDAKDLSKKINSYCQRFDPLIDMEQEND